MVPMHFGLCKASIIRRRAASSLSMGVRGRTPRPQGPGQEALMACVCMAVGGHWFPGYMFKF